MRRVKIPTCVATICVIGEVTCIDAWVKSWNSGQIVPVKDRIRHVAYKQRQQEQQEQEQEQQQQEQEQQQQQNKNEKTITKKQTNKQRKLKSKINK